MSRGRAPGAPAEIRQRLQQWLVAQWAGPRPTLAARCLQPLSWLYRGLAALHAGLYRSGLRRVQQAPVPVLVVGNLVAGGAGKTPAVIALLGRLRALGFTPGVVSRGHGRSGRGQMAVRHDSPAAEVGDEPLLIHLRTGAPVQVGADRAAAARTLCQAHPELDLLVADDGLQHHRLHADRVLLVFDERGAGNGLLLPAGPLRQPLPQRLPAHTLLLYNAASPSTALPGCTGQRRLAGVLPLADWWQGRAVPADGGWQHLPSGPLLAAAGLARPEPFFQMLEAAGLALRRMPLADHHPLWPLPWPSDTADVIVTEKDAVKLLPGRTGSTRVWVAPLDFQPEPAFDIALRQLCASLSPRHEP